jgi:rubredoxin
MDGQVIDLVPVDDHAGEGQLLSQTVLTCVACGAEHTGSTAGEITVSRAPGRDEDLIIEWSCPDCGFENAAAWNGRTASDGRWSGDVSW